MTPKNIPEQVLPQLPPNYCFKRWSDGTVMVRVPDYEAGDRHYAEVGHKTYIATLNQCDSLSFPRYIVEPVERLSLEEAVRRCVDSGGTRSAVELLGLDGQVVNTQWVFPRGTRLSVTSDEIITKGWRVAE